MSPIKVLSGLILGACLLPGQAANVVVNSGYRAPLPLRVAPGQVITLFVRPSTIRFTSGVNAGTPPLPTSLGGFSATLRQTFADPVAVPILSVNPAGNCTSLNNDTRACSFMAAVTVQIPFELVSNAERSRLPENFAYLTVAEDGVEGDPLQVNPVGVNLHVMTSCDSTLKSISPPCLPLVKHSDGNLVTPRNPAVEGETLSISVYGLGRLAEKVDTGALPVNPVNPVTDVKVGLRLGANPDAPEADSDPEAAVLSTEEVGVYEISFKVPAPEKDTPACAVPVSTNFAVTVARGNSSGSVGICLRIPEAPAE